MSGILWAGLGGLIVAVAVAVRDGIRKYRQRRFIERALKDIRAGRREGKP